MQRDSNKDKTYSNPDIRLIYELNYDSDENSIMQRTDDEQNGIQDRYCRMY